MHSNHLAEWQYWIIQNIHILSKVYGRNGAILDAKNWQFILIPRFFLPRSWLQSHSRLIIVLPKGPQIFYAPPERFYLDRGLKTTSGEKPTHYFEGSGFNDMSSQNLARFSFHLQKGWNPKLPCTLGTTLIDVLDGLFLGLDAAAKEAMR
ncbi:hypothetical protein HY405_00390 [Candidatus Microgenomates bacterium]|nr:hypothetical protein [Candidatus Microgenomates bacterium]